EHPSPMNDQSDNENDSDDDNKDYDDDDDDDNNNHNSNNVGFDQLINEDSDDDTTAPIQTKIQRKVNDIEYQKKNFKKPRV
ncbi:unnamed protein product, partial [Rotaria sp. Silwood1]